LLSDQTIDAAMVRAEAARANVHHYKIAAEACINPVLLSRLLNGHERLTPDVAQRLLGAIKRLKK
jgi:hypothetical protein